MTYVALGSVFGTTSKRVFFVPRGLDRVAAWRRIVPADTPLVAIGGLGVVWSAQGTRRSGFSHLLAGLGLMLMGLEFMKGGAISATTLFEPERLAAYPPIVFLLVGLVITAIIQSSSATIMITLSALYAGVIPLPSAAAAAIGADLFGVEQQLGEAVLGDEFGVVADESGLERAVDQEDGHRDAVGVEYLDWAPVGPLNRESVELVGFDDSAGDAD